MRFRESEYSVAILSIAIAICTLSSIMCFAGAYFLAYACVEFLIMATVSIAGLALTLYGAKLTGFPWISFDASGVKKKWLFNVNNSILWTECTDIGVLRTDVGSWGIHNWRYWIYFSKVPLTQNQIYGRENLKTINGQFIMLEYRPAVLDEILKYIEKGQIRNLHLLER